MNEYNGRTNRGWFSEGNTISRGNKGNTKPRTTEKKMSEIRQMFLDCITPEDTRDAYAELMKLVRAGEISAIHEFFDRSMGKATQFVDAEISNNGLASPDDFLTAILTVVAEDDWVTREKLAGAIRGLYDCGSSFNSMDS